MLSKGNRNYWRTKIVGNKTRDLLATRKLRRAGWRVLRVWEHELTKKNQARLVRRLSALIGGKKLFSVEHCTQNSKDGCRN